MSLAGLRHVLSEGPHAPFPWTATLRGGTELSIPEEVKMTRRQALGIRHAVWAWIYENHDKLMGIVVNRDKKHQYGDIGITLFNVLNLLFPGADMKNTTMAKDTADARFWRPLIERRLPVDDENYQFAQEEQDKFLKWVVAQLGVMDRNVTVAIPLADFLQWHQDFTKPSTAEGDRAPASMPSVAAAAALVPPPSQPVPSEAAAQGQAGTSGSTDTVTAYGHVRCVAVRATMLNEKLSKLSDTLTGPGAPFEAGNRVGQWILDPHLSRFDLRAIRAEVYEWLFDRREQLHAQHPFGSMGQSMIWLFAAVLFRKLAQVAGDKRSYWQRLLPDDASPLQDTETEFLTLLDSSWHEGMIDVTADIDASIQKAKAQYTPPSSSSSSVAQPPPPPQQPPPGSNEDMMSALRKRMEPQQQQLAATAAAAAAASGTTVPAQVLVQPPPAASSSSSGLPPQQQQQQQQVSAQAQAQAPPAGHVPNPYWSDWVRQIHDAPFDQWLQPLYNVLLGTPQWSPFTVSLEHGRLGVARTYKDAKQAPLSVLLGVHHAVFCWIKKHQEALNTTNAYAQLSASMQILLNSMFPMSKFSASSLSVPFNWATFVEVRQPKPGGTFPLSRHTDEAEGYLERLDYPRPMIEQKAKVTKAVADFFLLFPAGVGYTEWLPPTVPAPQEPGRLKRAMNAVSGALSSILPGGGAANVKEEEKAPGVPASSSSSSSSSSSAHAPTDSAWTVWARDTLSRVQPDPQLSGLKSVLVRGDATGPFQWDAQRGTMIPRADNQALVDVRKEVNKWMGTNYSSIRMIHPTGLHTDVQALLATLFPNISFVEPALEALHYWIQRDHAFTTEGEEIYRRGLDELRALASSSSSSAPAAHLPLPSLNEVYRHAILATKFDQHLINLYGTLLGPSGPFAYDSVQNRFVERNPGQGHMETVRRAVLEWLQQPRHEKPVQPIDLDTEMFTILIAILFPDVGLEDPSDPRDYWTRLLQQLHRAPTNDSDITALAAAMVAMLCVG